MYQVRIQYLLDTTGHQQGLPLLSFLKPSSKSRIQTRFGLMFLLLLLLPILLPLLPLLQSRTWSTAHFHIPILDGAYFLRPIAFSERGKTANLLAKVFLVDNHPSYGYVYGQEEKKDEVAWMAFLSWLFLANLGLFVSNRQMVGCFDCKTDNLVGFYMFHDPTCEEPGVIMWLLNGILWVPVKFGLPLFRRLLEVQSDGVVVREFQTKKIKHWRLERMAIEPDLQGKGLGSAMLKARILSEADKLKMPIILSTQKTINVKFYSKLGFERVHQQHFGPSEGGFGSFFMLRKPH